MKEKLSVPFAHHAASCKDLGQTGVVNKQGDKGGGETHNWAVLSDSTGQPEQSWYIRSGFLIKSIMFG